jgi:hypothetical protein
MRKQTMITSQVRELVITIILIDHFMSVVSLIPVIGRGTNRVLHKRRLVILVFLLFHLVTIIIATLRVTELSVTQACHQLLSETYLIQSALIDQGIIHSGVIAHVTSATHNIQVMLLSCLSIILEGHLGAHLSWDVRDRVNGRGVSQVFFVEVMDIFSKLIDFV